MAIAQRPNQSGKQSTRIAEALVRSSISGLSVLESLAISAETEADYSSRLTKYESWMTENGQSAQYTQALPLMFSML
eukprot:3680331-Karenia_brevis.AAC.1